MCFICSLLSIKQFTVIFIALGLMYILKNVCNPASCECCCAEPLEPFLLKLVWRCWGQLGSAPNSVAPNSVPLLLWTSLDQCLGKLRSLLFLLYT